jgi:uncharacterized membrane protein YfcA
MVIAPQQAWKLVLAVGLLVAIFLSAYAHAPRQAIAKSELRRLVLSAVGLYGVGLLASLTHHGELAGLVYAAGIVVCALAVWLSRGTDPEDPPDDRDEPVDEQPPPEPDGVPTFDWAAFEQQFREYSDRTRAGAHSD